jgi:hypothetical protein
MVKVYPPPFRREVSRIVAASNSKYKLGADYFCDGTDDQIEIQKAIDDVKQTGGTVFLKQGTYFLSGPIVIDKSNVTLEGEGYSTGLTLVPGVNDYAIKVLGPGVTNVRIMKLVVNGNGNYQSAGGCILLDGGTGSVYRSMITECYLREGKEAGIKLNKAYANIISNNFIADILGDGIKTTGSSYTNRFIGNEFWNCSNYCINITDTTDTYNIAVGNFFGYINVGEINDVTNTIYIGKKLVEDRDISIIQSMFQFMIPRKSGVWFTHSISGGPYTYTNLTANTLYAFNMPIPETTQISAMGFTLYSPSSANVRMGIYADNGQEYPGSLLWDSGTISLSGQVYPQANVSLTLKPGLYWLAIVSDGTPSVQQTNDLGLCLIRPTNPTPNGQVNVYQVSYTFGALPSTFPSGASVNAIRPFLALKKA